MNSADQQIQRQVITARLGWENYRWLKSEAQRQERSTTWMLDKLVTEARRLQEARQ